MVSVCYTLSNNKMSQEINNKDFKTVDPLFKNNGWHLTKNDPEHVIYTKFGFETEYFEIQLDHNNVYVSVPLKNTPYQYRTSFKNYDLASEYVEDKFLDFIRND